MVIGRDDRESSFFWLAAQGGYGIQSTAGASELAAALRLDDAMPETLVAQGVSREAVAVARLR